MEASNGCRRKATLVIAIDFRGYGLSEQLAEPEKSTFKDLVENWLPFEYLGIDKVIFSLGKKNTASVHT